MAEAVQDVDVRPAKGRRVRNEEGSIILGVTTVLLNTYWRRRIEDGDVELVDAPADTEKKGK